MLQPTSELSPSGSTSDLFSDQLLALLQEGSPLTAIGVNFELRGRSTVAWMFWAMLQDCVMGALNSVDSHVEWVSGPPGNSVKMAIFSEDETKSTGYTLRCMERCHLTEGMRLHRQITGKPKFIDDRGKC
jgi:hypothetical protein